MPSSPLPPRAGWAIRCRQLRLGLHLLAGLLIVALWFPLISAPHRRSLKICWSKRLLGILGIELRVIGELPDGGLLVANHISWIDIFVISAACPTAFVAKAEIRHWPMLGWLAKETDTLFIERGNRRHAQHIAHQMAQLLLAGKSVAVFPEGTTTDGRDVLPFHAALLQPAISAGEPVRPLAIRYRDPAGERSTAPAYIDQMSIGDSIRHTLAVRGLVVELVVLAALPTSEAQVPGGEATDAPATAASAPPASPITDRRQLARAAEAAIRQAVTGERRAD